MSKQEGKIELLYWYSANMDGKSEFAFFASSKLWEMEVFGQKKSDFVNSSFIENYHLIFHLGT